MRYNNKETTMFEEDITYNDIYRNVLENKQEFDSLCHEYFDKVVKPVWAEGGKKKLTDITPRGRGWSVDIDAKKFINSKDELKNQAFAWYVMGDLVNCVKYFRKDDIRRWQNSDWKILVGDLNLTGSWDYRRADESVGLLELAELSLKPRSSYFMNKVNNNIQPLMDILKISDIKELLPKGFNDYIVKNTRNITRAPKEIKNKMQFIMWKKALSSKPITEKHFKDMMHSKFGDWKMDAFNECYKIEGLTEKKYFINNLRKNWFSNVKGANLELAKTKLEQLGGRFDTKSMGSVQAFAIDFMENVNLKDSAWSVDEFITWAEERNVLRNVKFKEKENSYFTKTNFLIHIRKLHQ